MKKNWRLFLDQACKYYHKCDGNLQEAVRRLMIEKGFPEEIAKKFRCDFASGMETVISFDQDGEMADLDLNLASTMTKDEIINYMSRYMKQYTIETLKCEEV